MEEEQKLKVWKLRAKTYLVPISVGLLLAFVFEVLLNKSFLWGILGLILTLSAIRFFQFREYMGSLFEFGETIMYGKPRKKECWKDEAEFIKARNRFWKHLFMGIYWKFFGKHLHALINWWKERSIEKSCLKISECENSLEENNHLNVLTHPTDKIQNIIKEVP